MQQQDPNKEYLMEKYQSESPEDLIGKFLFRLISLKNSGNAQDREFFQRENLRRSEEAELGQTSILQRKEIKNVLLEIKNVIKEKEIDFSEILDFLGDISSSNSALYDVLGDIKLQHPEIKEQLANIAELTAKNKPDAVVFDKVIESQDKGYAGLGSLIVKLTEEVKKKKFPEEMKISGPIEIEKPKWWKSFEFSWEPLKAMMEKIKDHTFSVKVINQQEKSEKIDIDKLAKKIGGEVEKAIKQIPRSGGMGNPFAFDENGNLKVSGGGAEGGSTEAKQDAEIVLLGDIKTAIGNSSWVANLGIDKTDGTNYYFGFTQIGTTNWRIQRMNKTTFAIAWATGTTTPDTNWTNRATLTYSTTI